MRSVVPDACAGRLLRDLVWRVHFVQGHELAGEGVENAETSIRRSGSPRGRRTLHRYRSVSTRLRTFWCRRPYTPAGAHAEVDGLSAVSIGLPTVKTYEVD